MYLTNNVIMRTISHKRSIYPELKWLLKAFKLKFCGNTLDIVKFAVTLADRGQILLLCWVQGVIFVV